MDLRARIAADAGRAIYIRDLIHVLVGRDIKLRYKRSVLGVVWSLLNPVAQLLVFVFVFQRVTPLNIPSYPLFVFTGVLAWGWFSTALPGATSSITSNRELIRQPGFPAAILPMVPVLSSLVHFAIAMSLVILARVISGGLNAALLALPIVVALQFLVTLSLGYVTATIQVRFRDTGYIVGMLLLLGFFLTPVFYRPASFVGGFQFLYVANPMAHLITAYRDLLIEHRWPDVPKLLLVGLVATIVLWLGQRMFSRASITFVEET
jgi:homopolymeric O-antigen transport system permease protein